MKLLIIAAIIGVCSAARLEYLEPGYLPPNADGNQGSASSASANFDGSNNGLSGAAFGGSMSPGSFSNRNNFQNIPQQAFDEETGYHYGPGVNNFRAASSAQSSSGLSPRFGDASISASNQRQSIASSNQQFRSSSQQPSASHKPQGHAPSATTQQQGQQSESSEEQFNLQSNPQQHQELSPSGQHLQQQQHANQESNLPQQEFQGQGPSNKQQQEQMFSNQQHVGVKLLGQQQFQGQGSPGPQQQQGQMSSSQQQFERQPVGQQFQTQSSSQQPRGQASTSMAQQGGDSDDQFGENDEEDEDQQGSGMQSNKKQVNQRFGAPEQHVQASMQSSNFQNIPQQAFDETGYHY